MPAHVLRVRRGALLLACASSVLMAVLLMRLALEPAALRSVRTGELLGLLGLLVLPAATVVAVFCDRRAAGSEPGDAGAGAAPLTRDDGRAASLGGDVASPAGRAGDRPARASLHRRRRVRVSRLRGRR